MAKKLQVLGEGLNGTDGVSPIISTEVTQKGTKVNITDVEGLKTFEVLNGKDGKDGQDGYTPVKGVDYFDGEPGADGKDYVLNDDDRTEIAELAAELVEVPESSGGGIAVTGATPGQTVKIAEVDENGVPTAWEPVDLPSGGSKTWELIDTITLEEDVAKIEIPFNSETEVHIRYEGEINTENNDSSEYNAHVKIYANGRIWTGIAPGVASGTKTSPKTVWIKTDGICNGTWNFNCGTGANSGHLYATDITDGKINKITMETANGNHLFKAGSKIYVRRR